MDPQDFFSQHLILENEHALLTPLMESDLKELGSVAFDSRIWKHGLSNLQNEEDLIIYIKEALNERKAGSSYPFKIFDKQRNRVAGSTRFGNISLANKRAEIGWTWLHPDFHGSGLNMSCKFLLLKYAFETLQLNRIELKTDVLNLQSRKAILKIGAKEEGIFRKHMVASTGRVRDSIYFSIINEEWPKLKGTVFAGL
ncbi:MAG: GNAT family N-acetyltransferase [Bacteroidetes bacterium]|nr:MAG: GNAT family N-acetyltransferase [Bacteroidota bacterium]